MTVQADDEIEYGKSYEHTLESNHAELGLSRSNEIPEAWPHWNSGVPTLLQRQSFSERFTAGRVTHHARPLIVNIELEWCFPYKLSVLEKDYGSLPGAYQNTWTGVYRVLFLNAVIPRCCGDDLTGTMYIGKAGEKNWSNLRSRLMDLINGRHHVIDRWPSNGPFWQKFPRDSLSVQWAYTAPRRNSQGKEVSGAMRAERWLLACYRASFGELPPWNEKI